MPPPAKAATKAVAHLTDPPISAEEQTAHAFELQGRTAPVVQGAVDAAAHRLNGVHLLVGRGATLAGMAKVFTGLWASPPTWARNLSVAQLRELGAWLFRFGTGVALGTQLDPTPGNLATYWANGVLLPVPALRTLDAQGAVTLTVNLAEVQAAVVLPASPVPEARTPVGVLLSFDPFANPLPWGTVVNKKLEPTKAPKLSEVITARDAVRAAFDADPAAGATLWRNRLRWNPYAAFMPLAHLMSTLPAARRGPLTAALLDPAGGLTAHDYERVTATSAGVALLRATLLMAAADAPAAAAVSRCATTLGVSAADLTGRLVTRNGIEPPLPASSNVAAPRRLDQVFSPTFLGRHVLLQWKSYKQDSGAVWTGPLSAGSMTPGPYGTTGDARGDALTAVGGPKLTAAPPAALTSDQLADRLLAIRAICEIEGFGDAVRAADRALVSFGLQQFSFHVADEGTVLLRRVRGVSEFWFDTFFRSGGYDVGRAPQVGGKEVPIRELQHGGLASAPALSWPAASPARVDELREPAWLIRLTADGRNRWCVPGKVGTLKSGKPAVPTVDGVPNEVHLDCHTAFGFTGTTAGAQTVELLLRWAVAARLVPEVMQAQMEAAVHRFNRVEEWAAQQISLKLPGNQTTTRTRWEWMSDGLPFPVDLHRLFAGTVQAAMLVDCFINTPAGALAPARRAWERVADGWLAETGQHLKEADLGTSLFQARFTVAYLSERRWYTIDEPTIVSSAAKPRAVTWRNFCNRRRANNVAADRIAHLLDRLEAPRTEQGVLDPDSLSWRKPFTWLPAA